MGIGGIRSGFAEGISGRAVLKTGHRLGTARLPLHTHLLDTETGPCDVVMMVFDRGWRPRYRPISTQAGKAPEDWY